MEHRLAPQTCCELIDVIIKRTPYMHPICQNRGPFALSIMIEPAAISMTDDLRTSILNPDETRTRIDGRRIELLIKP
jgi:hypothetical protein